MSIEGSVGSGGASTIAEVEGLQIALDSKVTQNMFNDVVTDLATYDYVNASLINKLGATATAVNSDMLGGKTLATIEIEYNTAAVNALNTFLAGAPTWLDTWAELVNQINTDISGLAALTAEVNNRVKYTDIIDNLTTQVTNKTLSANQGYVLNNLVTGKASLASVNNFLENNIFQKNIAVGLTAIGVQRLLIDSDGINSIARFRKNGSTTNYIDFDLNAQKIAIVEGGTSTTLQQVSGNTALVNSGNNSIAIITGLAGSQANITMSAAGIDFKTGNVSQLMVLNNGNISIKNILTWGTGAGNTQINAVGTELQVKKGDNSDFATVFANFKFASTAEAETLSQTHTLTVKDSGGNIVKLLCWSAG